VNLKALGVVVAFVLVFMLYANDGHALVSVARSHPPQVDRGVVPVLRPGSCAYSEEDIGENTGEEHNSDAEEYGKP
jgi:hypothetical protein